MMTKKYWFLLFSTLLLLTACGGGGSSSGSSGGTPAGNLAGIYNGTVTLTADTSLSGSVTATDTLTIRIDPNGRVTVIDREGETAQGALSGNSFTVNALDRIEAGGTVFCETTTILRGTVSGNRITGTVSGQVCLDLLEQETNVRGTFEATK